MSSVTVNVEQSMYSETGDPLCYPCSLANEPLLIRCGEMIPIHWNWPDEKPSSKVDRMDVDTLLRESGATSIQGRVAQIAFGANRDVRNVLWKLNHSGRGKNISRDLIVVPAYIDDADVVACNLGYWGYIYGALLLHRPPDLNRPYLSGARTPVCVLLLDRMQMDCLHASEGVLKAGDEKRPYLNCDVAHLDVTLINGVVISAQLYALSLPFLSYDNETPVAFSRVQTANRPKRLRSMSQLEMLNRLAREIDLDIPRPFRNHPGQWIATALRQHRMNGHGQHSDLYRYLRAQIIERLCLHDEDKVVRCGNDGLSRVMSINDAWVPTPTLAQHQRQ